MKSTKKGGFIKSSFSGGQPYFCVEVAPIDDGVSVRDSKNPAAVLSFSHGEWGAFVQGVKNGEFDFKPGR